MLALFLAMAAVQDGAPTVCPATPVVPAELAGWTAMVPVAAAARAGDASRAVIAVGRGARVTLAPTAGVAYALAPARPGAAGSFGGTLQFVAPAAGRYRVALGAGAWIDVVRDGRAVASVAHGHGAACSPAKKLVDFDLIAGRYALQLAGSEAATLPVMVAVLRR